MITISYLFYSFVINYRTPKAITIDNLEILFFALFFIKFPSQNYKQGLRISVYKKGN